MVKGGIKQTLQRGLAFFNFYLQHLGLGLGARGNAWALCKKLMISTIEAKSLVELFLFFP
jgi:hypothetical protein